MYWVDIFLSYVTYLFCIAVQDSSRSVLGQLKMQQTQVALAHHVSCTVC